MSFSERTHKRKPLTTLQCFTGAHCCVATAWPGDLHDKKISYFYPAKPNSCCFWLVFIAEWQSLLHYLWLVIWEHWANGECCCSAWSEGVPTQPSLQSLLSILQSYTLTFHNLSDMIGGGEGEIIGLHWQNSLTAVKIRPEIHNYHLLNLCHTSPALKKPAAPECFQFRSKKCERVMFLFLIDDRLKEGVTWKSSADVRACPDVT